MHVRTGERGFETMSMEYQVQENCLTIFLPKEVDHHNAEEVKKSADAIIEKEHIKYVIFDFEQTDFMDSSGIGVIMGRYRMICLIGGEVWAVTIAVAVCGTLICIGIVRIFTPLRVDVSAEISGLDFSQHGENAYPSFNGFDS